MTDPATATAALQATARRPLWLTILAIYSFLLAIVTGIPQLYYVLYAAHLAVIGPHSDPLGQFWYWYVYNGQQGGYIQIDSGTLAGAIEDAFMLGPLYLVTGIGLWRRRPWVFPVGLITGAMIFYAIVYFFFIGVLDSKASSASVVTTVLSTIPYLVYPLCLIPTLLLHRASLASAQAR